MKIHIETMECAEHGLCPVVDAEPYPLDDDGLSALDGDVEVPTGREAAARSGAAPRPQQTVAVLADA